MTSVAFAVTVACALLSAIAVVRSPHMIRAVLWLGATLLVTAVLYAMIGASFLAGLQALLYVGGVVTLMIFGVMLTRRHDGIAAPIESEGSGRAAVVALGLFGAVAWAIHATPGLDDADVPAAPLATADLAKALLREHVLAFEVLSMLLLAAILGAVVVARRKDPGQAAERTARPATARADTPAEGARS